MTEMTVRRAVAAINDLRRSASALVGIAQGLLCDGELSDGEISFLRDWLEKNQAIAKTWPGDVIYARVRSVLEDGVVTEEERQYLIATLQQLVGGASEDLAEPEHVTELALDRSAPIKFQNSLFCLTGEFVFAPRKLCEQTITKRGGLVSNSVTKKVTYVVVGGLGSREWKHGSYGEKIEKAIAYKKKGLPIFIVHEDQWANALNY